MSDANVVQPVLPIGFDDSTSESNAQKKPVVTTKLNKDGTGEVRMQLAVGTAISRFENPLSNKIHLDRRIYNSQPIPSNFHDLVPLMRHYYETDGLFGTVIDVLIQLSIDNAIQNVTEDNNVKAFFDAIVETSNIKRAIKWAILEYYLVSNAFTFRINTGVRERARNGKTVPVYEWTVLNPRFTEVTGSLLLNKSKIAIRPDQALMETLDEEELNEVIKFLPTGYERFKEQLKNGESIVLPEEQTYHIARNKQPFQRYAPVAFKRLIAPMRVKEKYMELDMSTADGIINQVVIFKLGSDNFPITDEAPLKKFAQLIQTPGKAYQLVWNHALSVDIIRSDPAALDPGKYGPVNQELMYGFAVPEVLVGGKAGAYGKDWIAVKSLVERLKWGRDDIIAWLENEFKIIAMENGLKTWPKVKLGPINLEEEKTFKQIMMSLYEHGIVSAQTILENVGFEFLTEMEQLKLEKDIREKEGILVPNSPYQQSPGRPMGATDEEPRDRRTPSPAPSGQGSVKKHDDEHHSHEFKVAMAQSRFEEKTEEIYYQELVYLYEQTRKRVMEVIDKEKQDETRRREQVLAILLAFRDEMESIGARYIRDVFTNEFMSHTSRTVHDEFDRQLAATNRWNGTYVDKLYHDLKLQIEVALDKATTSDVKFFVDAVFDKEEYRLPHFAREGVRRAKFVGNVSAHIELGYTHGRWECSFNNSCQVCIDRHGQVFAIEQLMGMYPAHNRCQCAITYTIEV